MSQPLAYAHTRAALRRLLPAAPAASALACGVLPVVSDAEKAVDDLTEALGLLEGSEVPGVLEDGSGESV